MNIFVCGWMGHPPGARRRGPVIPTQPRNIGLWVYVRGLEDTSWHLRFDALECKSATQYSHEHTKTHTQVQAYVFLYVAV